MARRAKVIRFPKSPPEPPQADLVEVRRCRDETEALVVKSLLESEDIPCVLRSHLPPPLSSFPPPLPPPLPLQGERESPGSPRPLTLPPPSGERRRGEGHLSGSG